jgi:hypothetical protein
MRHLVASIESEFHRYKGLADGALAQVTDEELAYTTSDAENSIAALCRHISGNLRSRFTDFLTTDGEKPWRKRDEEFAAHAVTRAEVVTHWAAGWTVLLDTLSALTDADLDKTVTIRQQPLRVYEALHRSLSHLSYHVGQIVFVAKQLRGDDWKSLSIPRGQSAQYNARPTLERARDPRSIQGG